MCSKLSHLSLSTTFWGKKEPWRRQNWGQDNPSMWLKVKIFKPRALALLIAGSQSLVS